MRAMRTAHKRRLTPAASRGFRLMARRWCARSPALGIVPLRLPTSDRPRLRRADDITAHAPLFKDYARAARLLAKVAGWDESKHPRVPAGSPGGGQFQGGQGGGGAEGRGVAEGRSAAPGIGHNGGPPLGPPPEIPPVPPPDTKRRNAFAKIAARWLARALAGAGDADFRGFPYVPPPTFAY